MDKGFIQKKSKSDKKNIFQLDFFLGLPYYVMLVVFIIIPIFILVLYAFTEGGDSLFNIRFTLANFEKFFSQSIFIERLIESIWLAIRSTFYCLLICYPLAYMVSRLKKRTQTILVLLLTATMWINSLILMHSLKNVFLIAGSWVAGSNASYTEQAMFLGHDYSIIIGTIFLYMPYMFLPIYTQMTKIDPALIEGATDLGANKIQSLFKVVLPLTLSSVISSCLIVLLPATTTLVVNQIMGDSRRPLIANLIEQQSKKIGAFGEMAAYAMILSLIMFIFVWVLNKFDRYEEVLANEEE